MSHRRLTIITLEWFDLKYRMAEFGIVTQMGRSIFLGVSHVPIPSGRGPSVHQIFWDYTYAQMILPRATKFGMVTHVGQEQVYGGGGHRQPRSHLKGSGPSVSKFLDLLHARI